MVGGLVVAAAAFALLTQPDIASGLGMLVTATVVVSLGLAQVFTLATDQFDWQRAGGPGGATARTLGNELGVWRRTGHRHPG
jgi:hypothetical protein